MGEGVVKQKSLSPPPYHNSRHNNRHHSGRCRLLPFSPLFVIGIHSSGASCRGVRWRQPRLVVGSPLGGPQGFSWTSCPSGLVPIGPSGSQGRFYSVRRARRWFSTCLLTRLIWAFSKSSRSLSSWYSIDISSACWQGPLWPLRRGPLPCPTVPCFVEPGPSPFLFLSLPCQSRIFLICARQRVHNINKHREQQNTLIPNQKAMDSYLFSLYFEKLCREGCSIFWYTLIITSVLW